MAVSINDMPDKLFLSDYGDNYFVVLDVRKTFVLLWTAFYADYPHQVRKKAKEYEEWLKGKRDEMPVVKTSISESENYMMFDKYI